MLKKINISRIKKGVSHPIEAARLISHELAANWAFRFTNGSSPAPEILIIALCNRCNLQCQMCPQWGERGTSKKLAADDLSELTAEVLAPFIEKISLTRPVVHLTGGEPLIAKHFIDIITLLKNKDLRVSLTTNATLLEGRAEQLVNLGVDEIVISIDGTETIHDSIRGVKGTFSRLLKGIEAVHLAKLAKNSSKPLITTQTTISAANIDSLPGLVTFLSSKPIDTITLHHLEFTSAEVLTSHLQTFSKELDVSEDSSWFGLPQEPEIAADKLIRVLRQVLKIDTGKSELKIVPNFPEAEITPYYQNAGFVSKRFGDKCLFPWKGLIIYPNGDIIACPNYKVGNINDDSFSDIWNGPAYRRLRNVLKKRKSFPICSKCCWFYYKSI